MKEKVKNIASILSSRRVASLFDTFFQDETIGGKLILVFALLSLIVVNSPLVEGFNNFWHITFPIGVGVWSLSMDLKHWVNEGLMAFFFLVVGLEIKRELVKGELRDMKTAILPVGAAVGGMLVPALVYLIFNVNSDAAQGWGIPIATDIAFAMAVLSLLSKRVPVSLKVFLLTLAVADDIGAIFVIALFYAEIINYWYLAAAFLLTGAMFIFRRHLTYRFALVCLLGVVLWLITHLSGIHASIVGAVLGLLIPVSTTAGSAGVAERLEQLILPITTFVILPIFAFANAGFPISADALTTNQSVLWGVFLGLVVGKVIGISLASWLLVKLKLAQLPHDIAWRHVLGVGFIAGIGFTVSIFITELAFADSEALINSAKMAIFIASATSALIGYGILRLSKSNSVLGYKIK